LAVLFFAVLFLAVLFLAVVFLDADLVGMSLSFRRGRTA
jgi:hypothetical protein